MAWQSSFVLLSLLAAAAPASAQESAVQHCLALPRASVTPEAEYCQGILAANGVGRRQDQAGAFKHYLKAAQMGFAQAQAVVGAAYQRGWQVQADPGEAAQWYAKAAAQGHAGAELNLGEMYAKGDGVPKDMAKARQLIQAAAAQGLPPARQALAELGQGGPQPTPGRNLWNQARARYRAGDHAAAVRLVQQAAEAGFPTAFYQMGYFYENGDGVARSMAEAARWYKLGAEKGQPSAEAALGQLYEEGNTVPDDWVTAASWYAKSAQQGNKMGAYLLGRAYEYGIGVPLNLEQAIGWYDRAAAKGDGKASYMAQYLRDNHGIDGSSRDAQEQAQLGPLIKRWYAERPPLGVVFHNAAERTAFIQNLAGSEARARQLAEHNMQQSDYNACRNAGGDNCHPPITPAPR